MSEDEITVASEVTIRRPDGSVEVRPAYTSEELDRIVREGYAKARCTPTKRQILRRIAEESRE